MANESDFPSVTLATGELLRLPAGACTTLACERGAIWVTLDGESRDVVLSAGESLELAGGPPALLQAFEPSLVQLRDAPARCARDTRGVDVGELIGSLLSRPAEAWRALVSRESGLGRA